MRQPSYDRLFVTSLCVAAAVFASLGSSLLRAEEPPPTVVINSVPSPELELPLRYTLTPNVADIEAGNAAQSYYRALLLLPRDTARRYSQQQDDWLDLPLEEFPCEAAREWLGSYQNSLREVRAATYREDCDWDLQLAQFDRSRGNQFTAPRNARVTHFGTSPAGEISAGNRRRAIRRCQTHTCHGIPTGRQCQ